MALYMTDSSGKLIQVAGNFNPVYNANQLVASKTFTSSETSVTFNGLDIISDGGVYDFVISANAGTATATYTRMYVSNGTNSTNIDSNARYYTLAKYANASATYNGFNETGPSFLIGHSGSAEHCIFGTLVQTNKLQFESRNGSFGSAQYDMTFTGVNSSITNVKGLTFTNTSGFGVGSSIKIYKRFANAEITAARNSSDPYFYHVVSTATSALTVNVNLTNGVYEMNIDIPANSAGFDGRMYFNGDTSSICRESNISNYNSNSATTASVGSKSGVYIGCFQNIYAVGSYRLFISGGTATIEGISLAADASSTYSRRIFGSYPGSREITSLVFKGGTYPAGTKITIYKTS